MDQAPDRLIQLNTEKNTYAGNDLYGLRSPGSFAKRPLMGLTMFVFGSLAFAVLAYQLQTNDALAQWDMNVAKTFRAMQVNAPWEWMEQMLLGVFLGRQVVVMIGAILAVYFFHKRFWREFAMTLLGLGGGSLIWFTLSRLLNRARPAEHLEVLPVSGPSFPSGPAMLSLLCFGLLAYLLIPNLISRPWKWLVALLCMLAIASVGLSSLLFGTHYASDVIAGYALGLAWAGPAFTLAERRLQGGTSRRSQAAIGVGGLRAPGFFGSHPLLALALILLGGLSFAALVYNIRADGFLAQLDRSVYQGLLHAARAAPPSVNDVMLFGFFVGKEMIQWIVLLLSLYFLSRRYWLELAILQIGMQGGGMLKNLVIDYFARPRPPEQLGFVTTTLASFPSGHALGTTICYGFLAYVLIPKMPSPFWKWTLSLGFLSLVLFEGFSRIFHGNHYLSDVLAAYALGMAWLVFVCTVMEWIFMRGREARES